MLNHEERLAALVLVMSHLAQAVGAYVCIRGVVMGEDLFAYSGPLLSVMLFICLLYFAGCVSFLIMDLINMHLANRRGVIFMPVLLRNYWIFEALLAEAFALNAIDAMVGRRQLKNEEKPKR